jgi:hypothetical protein
MRKLTFRTWDLIKVCTKGETKERYASGQTNIHVFTYSPKRMNDS